MICCEEPKASCTGLVRTFKRKAMIRGLNPVNLVSPVVLLAGLLITCYNVHILHSMQKDHMDLAHPELKGLQIVSNSAGAQPVLRYSVFAKNQDSGYLKHVYAVLDRAGYSRVSYNVSNDWVVMWAHDYPFKKIRPAMMAMKPGQKVNKLPGSGFVTNKVNLATSGLDSSIPPAFKIPNDTAKLMTYAKEHPDKMFVQKNSNHRGIKIEKLAELDLKSSGSFVQEFIHDPFLIDGYKFDIGVYTMITSIDPLRMYVYQGDVLLRFCPKKYHPFDQTDRDKYVVHDDYRPTWEVPTLAKLYSDLGYTFKETLNTHIRNVMGKGQPDHVWDQIHDIIRKVYTNKEPEFAKAANNYPHPRAFFEMVRFDFVLDSKLRVYLMEVNMSPNLSSKHFASNRLLYEQAVYNLLRLAGVARGGVVSHSLLPTSKEEAEMQVSDKDLYVFSDECVSQRCSQSGSCDDHVCQLCKHCLTSDELEFLRGAYVEHLNRHACGRVYPIPVSRQETIELKTKNWSDKLTANNAKMHQWYIGKCLMELSWCH